MKLLRRELISRAVLRAPQVFVSGARIERMDSCRAGPTAILSFIYTWQLKDLSDLRRRKFPHVLCLQDLQ